MYWDRFDIVSAHYTFCEQWHTGQACPLYARLCRIQRYYRPSPMGGPLTDNAREILRRLEDSLSG